MFCRKVTGSPGELRTSLWLAAMGFVSTKASQWLVYQLAQTKSVGGLILHLSAWSPERTLRMSTSARRMSCWLKQLSVVEEKSARQMV